MRAILCVALKCVIYLKVVADVINFCHKQDSNFTVILITHYQRILKYLNPNFVHILHTDLCWLQMILAGKIHFSIFIAIFPPSYYTFNMSLLKNVFISVNRTERNTILSVILLWIMILGFCVPVSLSHGLISQVRASFSSVQTNIPTNPTSSVPFQF